MHTHTAEEISHPTGKNQTIQLKDIQKKLPLRSFITGRLAALDYQRVCRC